MSGEWGVWVVRKKSCHACGTMLDMESGWLTVHPLDPERRRFDTKTEATLAANCMSDSTDVCIARRFDDE